MVAQRSPSTRIFLDTVALLNHPKNVVVQEKESYGDFEVTCEQGTDDLNDDSVSPLFRRSSASFSVEVAPPVDLSPSVGAAKKTLSKDSRSKKSDEWYEIAPLSEEGSNPYATPPPEQK